MQCPVCNGAGRIRATHWSSTGDTFQAVVPCPQCEQRGITHCCEGENVDRATAMLQATEHPKEGQPRAPWVEPVTDVDPNGGYNGC